MRWCQIVLHDIPSWNIVSHVICILGYVQEETAKEIWYQHLVSYEGIQMHLEVTYVRFFCWSLGQVTLSTYAQYSKGKLLQHYAKAWMFSICHCVIYQYRFGSVQKSCWCWFHAYMCIIYPYMTCTIVLDTLFVGSKAN